MAKTPGLPIPADVASHFPSITQKTWDVMDDSERMKLSASASAIQKDPTGLFGQLVEHPAEDLASSAKAAFGQTEGAAKNLGNLAKVLTVGPKDNPTVLGDILGDKKPTAKPKAKAKAKQKEPDITQSELQAQIAQGNLWNELGQQLVGDQTKLSGPVENAISGGLSAPVASGAATQALSDMGLSPKSSASDWLNSEISQAKSNDAPLEQAMKEYGADYSQGQSGVRSALAGMGQANAEAIDTAPEADWMTAIVQHAMSNVNYYGEITPSEASILPPSVLSALSGSGGGGQGAAGSIPITDTPSQIAQAVQNYYAHGTSTTFGLPGSSTAAKGATTSGISGLAPTASNAAGT